MSKLKLPEGRVARPRYPERNYRVLSSFLFSFFSFDFDTVYCLRITIADKKNFMNVLLDRL